jgi:hypothetical protein
MTDLSGITVTTGVLDPQQKEALGAALDRIGGKMIDTVRIDTTHFVCTEGRGAQWEKAVEMNIPVVVPEWVDACETEGTIAGVRGYYLNADPKARQLGVIHGSSHQRTTSTISSATANQGRPSTQPQRSPAQEQVPEEPPLTPFPGGETSSQPQAQAQTQEVGSQDDEDDLPPPPPPPKDEAEDANESTQNGEAEATSTPEEKNEEPEAEVAESDKEAEKEQTLPQHRPEDDSESATTGDIKGKGKETEGDFNEVPL